MLNARQAREITNQVISIKDKNCADYIFNKIESQARYGLCTFIMLYIEKPILNILENHGYKIRYVANDKVLAPHYEISW